MAKFWSLVFLLVPILGVAIFAVSPGYKWWLPPDISVHGRTIDHLFYFILYLTGAAFVVTEGALFWFLWRFNSTDNRDPVKFTHGSHALEVVWTILPAATLLFIAIYQMNAWAESKIDKPQMPSTLEVMARQFEWRLRYPYPHPNLSDPQDVEDCKLGGKKNIFLVNDLHIPVNEEIVLDLKSADVLHSFFLPNMRVKQDAVPGMKIPVWFRATTTGTYDLACAELCGWGHYKMKGRLTVESRAQFDEWLVKKYQEQQATQEAPAAAKSEDSP